MKSDKQWADYADSFGALDEYNHFLADLAELIGPLRDRKILDLGCSNGLMCRLLAGQGGKLTGIDISAHAIELARGLTTETEQPVAYAVADARDLSIFEDETFDTVLAVNTLCSFGSDRISMRKIVEEVYRVVRPEGALVAVLPHPAFEHRQNCATRRRVFPQGYSYFDGGTENTLKLKIGDDRAEFTNTHWTLGDYSRFFQALFCISDIREPEPDERFTGVHPQMFNGGSRYPIYLLLKCIKG